MKFLKSFLELLTHINVFLTEYDMEYNKKMKNLPVFIGTMYTDIQKVLMNSSSERPII